MKYREIFKKSLADELKKRGHKCKTRDNYKNPKFKVFIFENTEQLNKDWSELVKVQ